MKETLGEDGERAKFAGADEEGVAELESEESSAEAVLRGAGGGRV